MKTRATIHFLIVTVLFAAIPSLTANNRYVRVGATGNNNGANWNNAWTSLNNINFNLINPGDTIFIAAGIYSSFTIDKNGTYGHPITYRRATASVHGTNNGWQNAYDGQVIIDGADGLDGIRIDNGNYVIVDGVTKYGIWVRNADYAIANRSNTGTNNFTLRYVESGDNGAYRNGEDGIQGWGDSLLVEYCYIHDNDSIGTHGDGIQWFAGTNITIRYNVFKNNGQIFMLTETYWGNDYINDLHVYYNVFYNRGGDHYNGISKKLCPLAGNYWYIYNNTFDLQAVNTPNYNGYDNIFSGDETCNRMIFKNNAVIFSNAGSVGSVTHSYNGYDNSGTYSVYDIPSAVGNVTAANLGFVNVNTADYHLLPNSVLIDKGTNLGFTKDFDGNPIIGLPDIGAFEYPLSTGIQKNEIDIQKISIYPNPFSKSTTIDLTEIKKSTEDNLDFYLYNVLGEEVERLKNISEKKVILEKKNLTSGIYFYKVALNNDCVGSGKLLVE